MNRHNLPLAWHAATDTHTIGWVMIAYSSNCLISPGWLASIADFISAYDVPHASIFFFFFFLNIRLLRKKSLHSYYNNPWLREVGTKCLHESIHIESRELKYKRDQRLQTKSLCHCIHIFVLRFCHMHPCQ